MCRLSSSGWKISAVGSRSSGLPWLILSALSPCSTSALCRGSAIRNSNLELQHLACKSRQPTAVTKRILHLCVTRAADDQWINADICFQWTPQSIPGLPNVPTDGALSVPFCDVKGLKLQWGPVFSRRLGTSSCGEWYQGLRWMNANM